MSGRVHTIWIVAFFVLLLCSQSIAEAATHVEVAVNKLNIRGGPGTTFEIVATTTKATRLPILAEEDEWTQVQLDNGEIGWVINKYIKRIDIPQQKYILSNVEQLNVPNNGQAEKSIRVKNFDTNLRAGPGTDYVVVGKVQPDQVYPVVQTEGSWHLIQLADNSTAYIAGWIVELIQPTEESTSSGSFEHDVGMIGNEMVYVYHTHNRESWRNVARSTSGNSVDDPVVNITLVGKRLGELLRTKGIQTIVNQDDFAQRLVEQKKSYSQSYEESYKAVSAAVNSNPNLQYIFDIHRDGDLPRSNVAITLNGKTYARVLFVIGTANPNYQENKKLADSLHARMEAMYPGLSRGIILKGSNQGNGSYNQHVSNQSVLLEIGGTNNTLEECYNTAEALAEVLASYISGSEIVLME